LRKITHGFICLCRREAWYQYLWEYPAAENTAVLRKKTKTMTMEQLTPTSQADDLDVITEAPGDDSMDDQPDGDRQLTTDSTALDGGGAGNSDDFTGGGNNDSDLGADAAGDIGPKHD